MLKHTSVMLEEVIRLIKPEIGGFYIDATIGLGGHTSQILPLIGKSGKVLCIDQNINSLKEAEKNLNKFENQCIFVNDNFSNILKIAKANYFNNINGIIYDLGLASWQIDTSSLGITFSRNEPLDMRLQTSEDKTRKGKFSLTAAEVINRFPVKKLAEILYQYGDVHNSWSVARRIDVARRSRSINTTFDLIAAIGTRSPKILAPIFQALRIYVNHELENLQNSLEQSLDLLAVGGRIVVISFHSGEDRIVKNIFRNREKTNKDIKILTKKPIVPNIKEIKRNSRSRSAKLRAIEKIR